MTSALVLAGHGSHITAATAGLVWALVDRLRIRGVADEVTAAFWKEVPSFHSVVNTLTADDITVVPLFTAQGYFTQTVIPAEMLLDSPLTQPAGRTIRYTRTLNEHPYLSEVVQKRVLDALAEHRLPAEQTAIAIIGHSTRRNPESRKATEAQAAKIRALGVAAQVEAVYLDDEPEIPAIYTLTNAPNLVAVPYFLALGSHTTIDVPEALGLAEGATEGVVEGRQVFYTAPVGIDPALEDVILELARDAGMDALTPNPSPSGRGEQPTATINSALQANEVKNVNKWRGFPVVGRDALVAVVEQAGIYRFGGLRLTLDEVRPWGDEAADVLETPSALRERVRENPFRPLPTSDDLPTGWRVSINSPEALHAVVETVYPGAVADWAANRAGTLRINSLDVVAARQTGMYRKLEALNCEGQAAVVAQVCSGCVRRPTWFEGATPSDALPCPEACNVWLSAALEAI
jgi:sirohydrochlorin cobaltochelatase